MPGTENQKKGGGYDAVPLDLALIMIEDGAQADVEALDVALVRLAQINKSAAQIVELPFFAGLTLDESAAALGLTPSTVDRQWRYTRSWLYCELADGSATERKTGEEDVRTRTAGR